MKGSVIKVRGLDAATYKVKSVRHICRLLAVGTAGAGFYIIANPTPAGASESRASLIVGATVQPVARIQAASMPVAVFVSAADVRRGYVEVRQPASLEVNSNSPDGIALDLMTMSPLMTSMIVSGLDAEQSLGADGGTLIQRWQHPQSRRMSLRFKFMLAPGIAPGRYPWPVQLGVRPL